jgi:hypothetical protein
MQARKLIRKSSFDPDVLEMLGDVFDDLWSEISPHCNPDNTQRRRLRLARIVLAAYRDGSDASSLKQAAFKGLRSCIPAHTLRTQPLFVSSLELKPTSA